MHRHRLTRIQRFLLVLLLVVPGLELSAQVPVNDNCASAFHIPSAIDYCSAPGEFTNENASGYGPATSSCLIDLVNEVWFTIIPNTSSLVITVQGDINGLGTLEGPGIFVFEGNCNNLTNVGCNTVSANSASVELTVTDLTLGEVYYIAVIGAQPGTFQLCIDQFTPVPTPEQDCDEAVVLCDKSPFYVETLTGVGDEDDEADGTCIIRELASVWYKWTCEESGDLTFTLTPNNWTEGFESDDLDFVLFELDGDIDDCDPANRTAIRCMASGANTLGGLVLPLSEWVLCNGPTGLRSGETDTVEFGGCRDGSNNWLAPAQLVAGRSYALLINNYSESGLGFSIEFGGSATFVGPQVDFEIEALQAFECDKTIQFINLSSSMTDPIARLNWQFGAGSTPLTATGTGPHNVVYSSFGDKQALLTVTSTRGCQVSKVVDLYVEPCCADTSTLALDAIVQDLLCPGVNSGVIEGIGINGAPLYQYSLNGADYQPSAVFPQLGPGPYTLGIIDEKGCTDEIDLDVLDAPEFTVDAGDTIYTDLGYPVDLNAIVTPNIFSSVSWTPNESLVFETDSLRPTAFAPGTTTYQVNVVSPAGCEATDDVVVLVRIVRPIYIPNVFSPNGDGVNDFFFASGGPAAERIEIMRVFNRWGGIVFEGTDIALGEEEAGWSGRYDDVFAQPGVYTYHIRIGFIDGVSNDYSGTVTVIR